MTIEKSDTIDREDEQKTELRSITRKTVIFPTSVSKPLQRTKLDCQTSIVVVGPNGAGKSRLGAWIQLEGPQSDLVQRVSAQRSIVFPEKSSPTTLASATEAFHWVERPEHWDDSTYEGNKKSLKIQQRYGSLANATITQQNDIAVLMTLLFSENYDALLNRENEEINTQTLVPSKKTLLRKIQALWEMVLPNRRLIISSGQLSAAPVSEVAPKPYHAKAMSDGERVIFYLIGQCLCAKEGAIIVVDEPEIHLHKAIQDSLWNSIERARPDCTFIYLSHDLTFAADRTGATQICLTNFSEAGFSWYEIEQQENIPDDVYLEILGSRKPILFVEGTAGSLDLEVYQMAYPEFSIKPLGGCSAVLSATKSFEDLKQMHHMKCFGLIDRDYLSESQIKAYEKKKVYTPKVAEIENIFLIPELIIAVANRLMLDESETLESVKNFVISAFKREIKTHALQTTHHRVTLLLGQFSSKATDIDKYHDDFKAHLSKIDSTQIYSEAMNVAQDLISANDYIGILQIFNRKDLLSNITHLFDIRRGTYLEKIRELAKRDLESISLHVKLYLPDFSNL
ncbi:DUF4435 domain-containing protein [Pseudomonas viridiflava]|uniref:DUF4435 domain-containing protein n=1 Tax=Pseudomonas viridiflava TaxID=33069 RepID=UPI002EA2CB60|nr:DUF4435 domain-containing protein [Pseudomonas viridiflava]